MSECATVADSKVTAKSVLYIPAYFTVTPELHQLETRCAVEIRSRLRRYGFTEDAGRVSFEFASTVAENYAKQGYIVEKYNAVSRSTDAHVTTGYPINLVGFGWTNAAYLDFLADLPAAKRAELTRVH